MLPFGIQNSISTAGFAMVLRIATFVPAVSDNICAATGVARVGDGFLYHASKHTPSLTFYHYPVLLCSLPTITSICQKYVAGGLPEALYDRERSGQKPKITGEVEAQLTLLACSEPPAGKARWTLRMLADKLVELQLVDSISDVAVMHRLKKMNLSLGE
jgi:hypothetical protein